MTIKTLEPLADLYETDETAWLDAMAELIDTGNVNDLDLAHLAEFLAAMARRDRREIVSRLTILIAHVLKWHHQPENRSKSWRRTVVVQRQTLIAQLESKTLRNHAEASLAEAYANALELAAVETELEEATFPAICPWTLDQLLSPEVLGNDN